MKTIRLTLALLITTATTALAAHTRSCRLCNAADVNFDGHVNGSDLSIQMAMYGQRVRRWHDGDLNGDRRVTNGDIEAMLRLYGCSCPVGTQV